MGLDVHGVLGEAVMELREERTLSVNEVENFSQCQLQGVGVGAGYTFRPTCVKYLGPLFQ